MTGLNRFFVRICILYPALLLTHSCGLGGSAIFGGGGGALKANLQNLSTFYKEEETTITGLISSNNFFGAASNIKRINSDNTYEDVMLEGQLAIKDIYKSPSGETYMALSSNSRFFSSKENYQRWRPCTIAYTDESKFVKCLYTIDTANYNESSRLASPHYGSDPIQFDSSGRVYFLIDSSSSSEDSYASQDQILFFDPSTSTTAALNTKQAQFEIEHFTSLPGGGVLVAGTSVSGAWLRKIDLNGSLTAVGNKPLSRIQSIADGSFLIHEGNDIFSITSAGVLDPTPYISQNAGSTPTHTVAGSLPIFGENFTTVADKLLSYSSDTMAIYYPGVPEELSVSINIRELRPLSSNSVAIYGVDSGTDESKLIIFDLDTELETEVTSLNQYEIVDFSVDQESGTIYFGGTRYSDGSYVLGTVDTNNSNAVSIIDTLRTGVSEIKSFN